MRIDVHTHIFPPEMIEDRSRFFPGESAFKLLYESPKSKMASAETLLDAMDRDGVDMAVVFGFPWENRELAARNNDYVLESAARSPHRLIPLACVNALSPGGLEEARRSLENGARGLGELAVYENADVDGALARFGELMDCCRDLGRIMMIHANEPVGHMYPGKAPFGLDFYYSLAKMATGLDLILAHWGGGLCFFELLKKEAPEVLKRTWYDTAASPFLYSPTIYKMMTSALGPDKILFGSDYPLLPPSRYFREMAEAGLTDSEMTAVTGESARKLLFPLGDAPGA